MSLLELSTLALFVIVLGFVVGALVKGVLGGGLLALGLPIMAMQIEPVQAVALFVVPVMISNIWQVFEAGHYRDALRRFWPFLCMLVVGVWFGAGALTRVDPKIMALVLGGVVMGTTLTQMLVGNLRILKGRSGYINPVAGGMLGVCGGATGMFAPCIVYFSALKLPKYLFVTQLALIAMFGSIPLYLRLLSDGYMDWSQLQASTLALLPTGLGLMAGFWIRKRISEAVFRKAVWGGLLILGAALIWRGLS